MGMDSGKAREGGEKETGSGRITGRTETGCMNREESQKVSSTDKGGVVQQSSGESQRLAKHQAQTHAPQGDVCV